MSKDKCDSAKGMHFKMYSFGSRYFPSVTGGRLRNRIEKSSVIT